MSLSVIDLGVLGAAALAAGAVNALAGGGTLITFPALTAVGVPALNANITNTVALSPGYIGGTLAQREDLTGQRARVRAVAIPAIVGGLVGGALLLVAGAATFRALVPWLILFATPADLMAFSESPPPTTLIAPEAATALARATVP